MVLFHRLGLRSGGFVTAAYLAAVAFDPRDLLFTAAVAGTTYVVVARVMGARLMLFGRRKVAMMMLVATSLAWAAESALIFASGGQYHPWQGFSAIALMIPGLLANDAERQGPERTLWGAALATLTVLVAMNLLTTALDLIHPIATAFVKNYP
jgi:poly-gamma-glutamate biosynthesis protein PgsC/CapC